MCRPVSCNNCNLTTWIGCGLHIERAMSSVPKDEWCTCTPISGEEDIFPPKLGEGKLRIN